MARSRKGMYVRESQRRAAEKAGEEKGVEEQQKCSFVTETVKVASFPGLMPFLKTWNTEKSVGLG